MRSNRARRTVAQLAQRDLGEIPHVVLAGVYRSLDGDFLEHFLVGESSASLLLILVLLAREAGNDGIVAVATTAAVPPRLTTSLGAEGDARAAQHFPSVE